MEDSIELCLVCEKPVPGFEYEYCCNSFDCGCGGRPIEPCVCSTECWNKLLKIGDASETN